MPKNLRLPISAQLAKPTGFIAQFSRCFCALEGIDPNPCRESCVFRRSSAGPFRRPFRGQKPIRQTVSEWSTIQELFLRGFPHMLVGYMRVSSDPSSARLPNRRDHGGSQHPFGSGIPSSPRPYPPHYRAAFACSAVPLPLRHPLLCGRDTAASRRRDEWGLPCCPMERGGWGGCVL